MLVFKPDMCIRYTFIQSVSCLIILHFEFDTNVPTNHRINLNIVLETKVLFL